MLFLSLKMILSFIYFNALLPSLSKKKRLLNFIYPLSLSKKSSNLFHLIFSLYEVFKSLIFSLKVSNLFVLISLFSLSIFYSLSLSLFIFPFSPLSPNRPCMPT